ncbi:hypothetical protein YWS52_19540 [Chitiniphilus shinanonensis]
MPSQGIGIALEIKNAPLNGAQFIRIAAKLLHTMSRATLNGGTTRGRSSRPKWLAMAVRLGIAADMSAITVKEVNVRWTKQSPAIARLEVTSAAHAAALRCC